MLITKISLSKAAEEVTVKQENSSVIKIEETPTKNIKNEDEGYSGSGRTMISSSTAATGDIAAQRMSGLS
jgi:hypothetical protein